MLKYVCVESVVLEVYVCSKTKRDLAAIQSKEQQNRRQVHALNEKNRDLSERITQEQKSARAVLNGIFSLVLK